ncbi:ABC-type branched-chain amino acid transport system, substrate-binding protein [Desulfacinum hydrothermale DSM 13146]|uniref:ABC-type branched-chain amino acid transport system, substrate-binding protein n=1 Tax=Desulfacinum hydrothermale DSM 13146 TaxID=1121390 RepID=A0A1W1XBC1_9BACT|nr:ABC transporter substrate-binding protein [Desulfacinum hydrothermale]SMC21170.1 ABC-type branched-chain amino acid transport system, substrate-binding protein [Desulfacinum hydrothermale DSM 13146]
MARRLSFWFVLALLAVHWGCASLQRPPKVLVPSEIFHGVPSPEAQTLYREARTLEEEGRLQEAISAYERIAQFFPTNAIAPRALTREAAVWIELGDPEKAQVVLERVLRDFPQWKEAVSAQIGLLQARWLRKKDPKILEEGLALWNQTSHHPQARQALCRVLASFYRDLKDTEAALRWLAQGYGLSPSQDDLKALDALAFQVTSALDAETTERLLQTVSQPRLRPFVTYRRALLLAPEEQREALLQILAQYPEHPVAQEIERRLHGAVAERIPAAPQTLGFLAPLSGPHASFGRRLLSGAALALDQWNESSPEDPVKLVVRDSGADPDKAVAAFSSLVSDHGALSILGPVSPRCANAMIPLMNRWAVPVLSFTEKRTADTPTPFLFHAFVDQRDMIQTLVDYCMDVRGFIRYAVLYPDETYGRSLSRLFVEEVQRRGGQILAQVSYTPQSTDFKQPILSLLQQAQKTTGSAPDSSPVEAVFIPDAAKTVALLAPQLPYYNVVDATLLGTNLWEESSLVSIGGVYVENALFPSAFHRDDPVFEDPQVADFTGEYKKIYGKDPDYLAAQGYEATRLLLQARRKAMEANGGTLDRLALRQALLNTSLSQGPFGAAHLASDGHLVRDYPILQVQNGNLVRVYP